MKRFLAILGLWLMLAAPAWANRLRTVGLESNNFTATEWNATSGAGISIVTTTVHSGTYAIRINQTASGAYGRLDYSAMTSGTIFVRSFYYFTTLPNAAAKFMEFSSGGAGNSITYVTAGTTWQINSVGGGTSTGAVALSTGQWYRFELDVLLSDTVGTVTGRLYSDMSTTPLETLSLTNQDTLPTNITQCYIGAFAVSNTTDLYIDDIIINNDTGGGLFGSTPGPSKIARLDVASDSAMAWEDETAGVSVTDNVDDPPGTPNDADYNFEDDTLNQVDRMNVGTLPAEVPSNADIISVDVYSRNGSNQTSTSSMRLKLWDEGGSLTDGPTFNCGLNGWQINNSAAHLPYEAGSKTKANVESFDLGYENLTDDATRPRRVSALWANVEWIEAAGGGKTITGAGSINGPGSIN